MGILVDNNGGKHNTFVLCTRLTGQSPYNIWTIHSHNVDFDYSLEFVRENEAFKARQLGNGGAFLPAQYFPGQVLVIKITTVQNPPSTTTYINGTSVDVLSIPNLQGRLLIDEIHDNSNTVNQEYIATVGFSTWARATRYERELLKKWAVSMEKPSKAALADSETDKTLAASVLASPVSSPPGKKGKDKKRKAEPTITQIVSGASLEQHDDIMVAARNLDGADNKGGLTLLPADGEPDDHGRGDGAGNDGEKTEDERRKVEDERRKVENERRKVEDERREWEDFRTKLQAKLQAERMHVAEERRKVEGERRNAEDKRRRLEDERRNLEFLRRELELLDTERRKIADEQKEVEEGRKALEEERKKLQQLSQLLQTLKI